MTRLLIVDDERNIRRSLVTFFESLGHTVRAAESGTQAVAMLAETQFDLVLTDYRMAEMSGLELLREIKKRAPESLVILMTAFATVENAVEAMKSGAYDYVTKPFSLEQIQHTVDRALHVKVLQAENRALRSAIDEAPLLDSHSAAMQRLLETARQAASSDATILLAGEIADLTPTLQTKFLRFLQDQNFERVGGEHTIHVDARIIAASNRDLESEVAAHRFREDLYYRL